MQNENLCGASSDLVTTSPFFFIGAAAQEIIKVITGQFVIFNNTYIYSGMSQTSATFQL